jgi:heat shock protein HslJ
MQAAAHSSVVIARTYCQLNLLTRETKTKLMTLRIWMKLLQTEHQEPMMRNKTSKNSPVLHCVFAFIAVLAIPKFAEAQSVTDGNWAVGSSRGAPSFSISGPLLSGTTGCRSFTGEFTGAISRGRMEIAPIAGQCPRAQHQAENRFLTQLRSTRSFSVRNGKLEARNPAGHLLFSATRTHRQLAVVSPAITQATRTGNGSWRPSTISGLTTVAPSSARPIVRMQRLFRQCCDGNGSAKSRHFLGFDRVANRKNVCRSFG